MELFGLHTGSFLGAAVADVMCGPWGGMLTQVKHARAMYPLERYRYKMKRKLRVPSLFCKRMGRWWKVPDGSCDMVFCLDVFEHDPAPSKVISEITRMTRVGGSLYVFLHVDNDAPIPFKPFRWLAKHVHQVPRTFQVTRSAPWRTAFCWQWSWVKWGRDRVNEDPFARAIWGCVTKVRELPSIGEYLELCQARKAHAQK
jgi:SAM-dependent methyltransferase